ncbi:MAG TPA: class I SAM-dependent methyltransferase [Ilumatobacteraceae bacterium]|nr:class I SAM-dependent methyltransferase [Ilumatobacteraceae bacterium]
MSDYRSLGASPAVYEYLVAHSSPPDPVYAAISTETAERTGRAAGMQIGPDQFVFMRLLTQLLGARLAVEIGTFTGSSAAAIAGGLAPGGRLICCDVSEEWTAIARRQWQAAGLADRIDLRIAPAIETVQSLPDEPIDLAFVDADKTSYVDYYEALVPRLRPGGVLLADNVLWSGQVADPSVTDDSTVAIRAFNQHVAADDRVEAVVLSIGDGVTLARRR